MRVIQTSRKRCIMSSEVVDTFIDDEVEVLYGQRTGDRGIVKSVESNGEFLVAMVNGGEHYYHRCGLRNVSLAIRTVPNESKYDWSTHND